MFLCKNLPPEKMILHLKVWLSGMQLLVNLIQIQTSHIRKTGSILKIDNLRLDGNTISSTNANGNIILDPNGSGIIDLSAVTTVSGILNANGGIAVTLINLLYKMVTGNTAIAGTLAVTGVSTLDGLLNANAGIAVDANKFTVADTGNTYIAGTLEVDGKQQN